MTGTVRMNRAVIVVGLALATGTEADLHVGFGQCLHAAELLHVLGALLDDGVDHVVRRNDADGFVTLTRFTCFYCPSGESQVVQFQWFRPAESQPKMASTCLM
jgi:hypothetical protein